MRLIWIFCIFIIATKEAESMDSDTNKKLESMEKRMELFLKINQEMEARYKKDKEMLEQEIKTLKHEKESQTKLQQCEDKMLETNSELLKMINDVRKLNEENSKCNLFLTTCMTQKSQEKCEKSNENQITVSAMDKLLKINLLRQWVIDDKFDNYNLDKALLEKTSDPRFPSIASVLISMGADVNAKDENGETALHKTAFLTDQNYDKINNLLELGAEINIQNNDGYTALMKTIESGIENIEIVQLLLNYNTDVNLVNNQNETALILASKNGFELIFKLLVNNGAKIDAIDIYGKTSLRHAVDQNNYAILAFLINNGANIENSEIGWNALSSAVKNENINMINLLLLNHANVNALYDSYYNSTMLMQIASTNRTDILKIILENGAEVNSSDIYGTTALMKSVSNIENVKLLLKYGADINAQDNRGWTVLMHGLKNFGWKYHSINEFVDLLLKENNINLNLANNENVTAIMIASQNTDVDIFKKLFDHGANLYDTDINGNTCLLYAVSEFYVIKNDNSFKNLEIKESAMREFNIRSIPEYDSHGFVINREEIFNYFDDNRVEIVILLLKHNLNIDETNKNNETALMFSARNGNENIVKIYY